MPEPARKTAGDVDGSDESPCVTRGRLLTAAGQVFAEHGFRRATVRDICRQAGANVAAVNYHFGDKERLYVAVLEDAQRCSKCTPTDDPTATPRQRLHNYINWFLARMFDTGRPAWQHRLMALEMIEPTAALSTIVEQSMRPSHELLNRIVADAAGVDLVNPWVMRASQSIVGQMVFPKHCKAVIERLYPGQRCDAETISALADHITEFSWAAIQAFRHRGPCGDPAAAQGGAD